MPSQTHALSFNQIEYSNRLPLPADCMAIEKQFLCLPANKEVSAHIIATSFPKLEWWSNRVYPYVHSRSMNIITKLTTFTKYTAKGYIYTKYSNPPCLLCHVCVWILVGGVLSMLFLTYSAVTLVLNSRRAVSEKNSTWAHNCKFIPLYSAL